MKEGKVEWISSFSPIVTFEGDRTTSSGSRLDLLSKIKANINIKFPSTSTQTLEAVIFSIPMGEHEE